MTLALPALLVLWAAVGWHPVAHGYYVAEYASGDDCAARVAPLLLTRVGADPPGASRRNCSRACTGRERIIGAACLADDVPTIGSAYVRFIGSSETNCTGWLADRAFARAGACVAADAYPFATGGDSGGGGGVVVACDAGGGGVLTRSTYAHANCSGTPTAVQRFNATTCWAGTSYECPRAPRTRKFDGAVLVAPLFWAAFVIASLGLWIVYRRRAHRATAAGYTVQRGV